MQFNTQTSNAIQQLKTSALFLGIFQEAEQTSATDIINHASNNLITSLRKQEFKANLGDVIVLRHLNGIKAERIILIGLSKKSEFNTKALLSAHEQILNISKKLSLTSAVSTLIQEACGELSLQERARLAARAIANADYSYQATLSKSKKSDDTPPLKSISFLIERKEAKAAQAGLDEGLAIATGMKFTRDLGNLPANICTPTYLGTQAKELAKQYASIKAEVLGRKQIENLKMGAFLSVADGSDQEPAFIVLKYNGSANTKDAPIVLVGKGITFDTGGISLKPGVAMDEMKYDMCGAATVLGVFKFIAETKLPINLVGLIPSTENMPSGRATKPGDVVKSMSGQTIEVLNTDAEGRLVLCDALTYAERFKPKHVIDMATLTGACIVALGTVNSGLFGNDEHLVRELQKAGQQAQDRAWPLPLDEEYEDQLKSHFADMGNISNCGPKAGAIIAASFLSRFTKSYSWAHLDIAGTAWDKNGSSKGAIGRPVPLIAQFLLNHQ